MIHPANQFQSSPIVTLEGFEPPHFGPKPNVLPLDERAIKDIISKNITNIRNIFDISK
jgi:hypothetical protein